MATRKKTATAAAAASLKKVQLPKGFVALTGDFAKSWDFGVEKELIGRIVKFGGVQSKYKQKGEKTPRMQRNVVIARDDKTGEVTVWEKAALAGLFDGKHKPGTHVYLRYMGERKVKGRKQAMHDFVVAVRK